MKPRPRLDMTRQRQVILDELRKVTSHPTADQVYEMARKVLPRISLGTVYRNLEVLSERGTIRKLWAGSAQARYDANLRPHYHIRCETCGRVDDVEVEPVAEMECAARAAAGYVVTGHHVEFNGICPKCVSSGRSLEKELT